MFDLSRLAPLFVAEADAEFLRILIETNRVRYDWGYDHMWVWPGDDKNPASESDARGFSGEEFHKKMFAVFGPGLCYPTTAGFVIDLLACGLDIQIAKKEPFKDDYLAHLIRFVADHSQGNKIGTVMQFVPKTADSE